MSETPLKCFCGELVKTGKPHAHTINIVKRPLMKPKLQIVKENRFA